MTNEEEKPAYLSLSSTLSAAARSGDMSEVIDYLKQCGRGDGLSFTDCFTLADLFEAKADPNKSIYLDVVMRKSQRGPRMLRDIKVRTAIRVAKMKRAGVADLLGVRPQDVLFVWQKPSGKKPEVAYFTTKKGGERVEFEDAPKKQGMTVGPKLSEQAWEKIAHDGGMSVSHVKQL